MCIAGKDNLAEHLVAALAPCQYEGLLSRRAVADICGSEAGSLPAGMTSLFGFECRLGREEPVADFLVRIGAEPEEWPVLDRYVADRGGEIWNRIGALLGECARPGSPLSAMLQNLWLEYDIVSPGSSEPVPSVFFGTDRLTHGAETEWAAEWAGRLRGEPLSTASQDAMSALVAALPESAKLFQVGVMCSRPRAPLRVCVIGEGLDEVSTFLAAAGWSGAWPRVEEVLKHFTPVIDHIALDLDIQDDGQLAQKLGIELYQRHSDDLGLRIHELTNRLTDAGLCLPQKAIGLLTWNGITHERRHRDLWPDVWIARRALRGGSESSTFCRWLHHIKIVFEPGEQPTAKAYMAVSHAFLADSAIREALERATLLATSRVALPRPRRYGLETVQGNSRVIPM